MRASRASELENFGIFYILKVLFSFNTLSVLQIFCRYKWYVLGPFWALFGHFYIILKVLFLSIFCRYKWYVYGIALYINAIIPTKHLHCENLCLCERAERASLENFGIFYIVKVLFLSIFCRYKLMICLSANMYRQNSEKALLGGGAVAPPPLWLRYCCRCSPATTSFQVPIFLANSIRYSASLVLFLF